MKHLAAGVLLMFLLAPARADGPSAPGEVDRVMVRPARDVDEMVVRTGMIRAEGGIVIRAAGYHKETHTLLCPVVFWEDRTGTWTLVVWSPQARLSYTEKTPEFQLILREYGQMAPTGRTGYYTQPLAYQLRVLTAK
jgi:hypothetical protein